MKTGVFWTIYTNNLTERKKMAYQHRNGSGSLFPNNYKNEEKQPDLKGEVMVQGEVMAIAGWKRKDRNGNDWISVNISKLVKVKQNDMPDYENQSQAPEQEEDLSF